MRVSLGFLGIVWAAGTAVVGFTACGSSVAENAGGAGTGAGGAGGQSTTSTTITSTTTGTTTTGTTTTGTTTTSTGDNCQMACSHVQTCLGFDLCGQGFNFDCTNPQYDCAASCINNLSCGDLTLQSAQQCLQKCAPQDAGLPPDAGDPCMNACAHVQQCFGFDVCAQLGTQIDCSTPQNACIADCVNSKTCAQLDLQTFQTCQTMCQGTATDGGGSAQACQQCALQSCGQAVQQCYGDQACQGWLNCVQGCNMTNPAPSCYTTCDAQNANAKTLYQAIYACTCQNCSAECGSTSDPCGAH